MSAVHQLNERFGNAWDHVTEGWQELRHKARHALTRFTGSERDTRGPAPTTRWTLLAAEMTENDKNIVIKLEVPGMDAGDFDVRLDRDVLLVTGEKHAEKEHTEGQYHITERAYGRFERAIPLPTGAKVRQTEARYKNGVLTVSMDKDPNHGPRRVGIKVD